MEPQCKNGRALSCKIEDFLFLVGIATAAVVARLQYKKVDDNLVPVFIFKDNPSLFHAFLISLNFGFTAAVVTISLREKAPALARFGRISAVACALAAAGFLSYSALLTS